MMMNTRSMSHGREYIEKSVVNIGNELAINNNFRLEFDSLVDEDLGKNGSLIKFKLITDNKKVYFMIGKVIAADEDHRKNSPIEQLFKQECATYSKLFPAIDNFLANKNKNAKFQHAKCYLTNDTKYEEIVILDDITCKGFELSKSGIYFTLNETLLVLEQLASFHAINFVLKNENFQEYKSLCNFYHPVLMDNENTKVFNCLATAINNLQIDFGHSEDVLKLFQTLKFEKITKLCHQGCEDGYRILGHDDDWYNNMMIKMKGDEAVEAHLLDWQETKISSPAHDLLFFLFTSVDIEVRKLHFSSLLDKYYAKLCAEIRNLDGDPEKLYPENVFREHLSIYSAPALFRFLFIMTIVMEKPPFEVLLEGDLSFFTPEKISKDFKNKVKQTLQEIKKNDLHSMWEQLFV